MAGTAGFSKAPCASCRKSDSSSRSQSSHWPQPIGFVFLVSWWCASKNLTTKTQRTPRFTEDSTQSGENLDVSSTAPLARGHRALLAEPNLRTASRVERWHESLPAKLVQGWEGWMSRHPFCGSHERTNLGPSRSGQASRECLIFPSVSSLRCTAQYLSLYDARFNSRSSANS